MTSNGVTRLKCEAFCSQFAFFDYGRFMHLLTHNGGQKSTGTRRQHLLIRFYPESLIIHIDGILTADGVLECVQHFFCGLSVYAYSIELLIQHL